MSTNVIEFPCLERQRLREIEVRVAHILAEIRPEFADDAKARIEAALTHFKGAPPFRMELHWPCPISERDADLVVEQVRSAVRVYRQEVAHELELLLTEICRLEVLLCGQKVQS